MSGMVTVNGVRYRKEDADRMVQAEVAAVVTDRVASKAAKVAAFIADASEEDLQEVLDFQEQREEFAAWKTEKAERAAEAERDRATAEETQAAADAAAAQEKANADAAPKKAAEKAPAPKKTGTAPSAPAGE